MMRYASSTKNGGYICPPKGGEQGPPKRPTGPPLGRLLGRGLPLTPWLRPHSGLRRWGPRWAVHMSGRLWTVLEACSALSIPLSVSVKFKKRWGNRRVCSPQGYCTQRRQGCFAAEAVGSRGTAVRRLSHALWGGQLGYPQPGKPWVAARAAHTRERIKKQTPGNPRKRSNAFPKTKTHIPCFRDSAF